MIKRNFYKLLVLLLFLIGVKQNTFGQTLTVPNYTACPCQTITASATWNNVSNITYSLWAPPATTAGPPSATWGNNNSFPIFNCSAIPASFTYTLVGTGSTLSGPVTNTATFILTIAPPAPMTLTNNQFHCNGSNITITAPIGGSSYNYSGAGTPGSSSSNVIVLTNAQANWGPQVTVTSVINGCTVTGQANISVAPLLQITINPAINVCQGQNANLSSNLPGGQNYQWYDNYNTVIPGATLPTYTINNTTVNSAGSYSVHIDQPFNGIFCPYGATTQVNVVATNPVVPAASPGNIVCQGTNLNLSASAGGASAWLWNGPGFTSSIANPVISPALTTASGVYTVKASFTNGFLTCNTTETISIQVIGVSSPVITMPSSICQGANFVVNGSASSNPNSYSWSGPLFSGTTATTGSTIPIYSVEPNASGTQFLTVYFGSLNCPSTSSVQLNVIPVTTVSVIPPGQVCSPNNAFLQALATGANQYIWVGPNSYTVPTQNGAAWVYYPTSTANGIYTVTAYFGGGSNLVCSSSNTVQLTVNAPLNFSLVPRNQVCYNTPVTISGPPGATSYSWTSSTGFTSSNKDITFTSVQPNNSGTYTLTVYLGPCKTIGESELVVLDPITFTLTPFDRTICRGDTIHVEGGVTGGSQNYAYVWNPSIYLESSTGQQQQGVPLGTLDYNLLVHDIACPNYTIAHNFKVNVLQPPQPNLELSVGAAGCEPLVQLYNPKTGPEAFVTTYDFGGNLVKQGTPTLTMSLNAGTYTLTVTSTGTNGCSGKYVFPYPITVYPKPGTDVSWSPETPTTNDEVIFYPTSRTEPMSYYNWNFLGGITPGDTNMVNTPGLSDTTNVKNPSRIYQNYGIYPVVLISTNEFGCTDTVSKFVKIIDELQLYVPNSFTPNDDGINDLFMAKGTGIKLENFSMDIFTRAGTNVFTTKDINEGWNGKLGGQFMKDAVYIYRIRAVGMNGEGRREITGYFSLIK